MRILLPTTAGMVLCAAASAQPTPFGCHFHRQQQAGAAASGGGPRSDIQEVIARSEVFDLLDFEISIDVTDYAGQRIKAATTITFQALQAGVQEITFDLYQLQVDSVIGAGGPLSFTYDGELLTIALGDAPPVGVDQVLTVHYQGIPHRDPEWGGFYFASDYIYNLGIGISTIPPHFGKVWYPCFDSFVERATYTYHVKSAGGRKLRGQGTFLGETVLGGDTVVRSYRMAQPIPSHISAIAVANYDVHQATHNGVNGPIPITLTAKAANLPAMVTKFADLGQAIDVCEYWYGPYGFERVGYVLTTDGALEIPTNVAYPQFMTGQTNQSNRELLTHELGHHWWGDVVTPYIHNDMWLKEGPAEYTTHLIEEWIGGQAGLMRAVKNNLSYVLRQAHVNDGGFQPLSPMPDPHIYGTHTYYKGAAVMHNLRGYLGDSLFRHAMRTIQVDHAYTTLSASDFRNALEAATGQDLDAFFNAWVFAPGYSVFEVRDWNAVPAGASWTVGLTIGQKLRGTTQYHEQVPIDLSFLSATGQVHDLRVVVGGPLTELSVSCPFQPAMVALNRYARLNQARLDHEVTAIPGQPVESVLPHVDFRLFVDALPDTALVRVDHIWAAPDPGPLGAQITAISGTHYWNVDGLWPEGCAFRSRLNYSGTQPTQLDHALIAGDETGICLVYRPTPNDAWQVLAEQEVVAGALTNGTGYINVGVLRKGQYAFAKTNGIIGTAEHTGPENGVHNVFPVPATDRITVTGHFEGSARATLDIIASDGRIVRRQVDTLQGPFTQTLDTRGLPSGAYLLRVMTTGGIMLGTRYMEIDRR